MRCELSVKLCPGLTCWSLIIVATTLPVLFGISFGSKLFSSSIVILCLFDVPIWLLDRLEKPVEINSGLFSSKCVDLSLCFWNSSLLFPCLSHLSLNGSEYCWHWFWSTGQEFYVWECFLANISGRIIANDYILCDHQVSFHWRRHESRRNIVGFLVFVLPWLWLYSSSLCLVSGHTPLRTRPRVHSLAWWYTRFCKGSACDTERPWCSGPPHIWHSLYTSSSLTKIRFFHPHTLVISSFSDQPGVPSVSFLFIVFDLAFKRPKCRPTRNSDASFHTRSPAPGMLEGMSDSLLRWQSDTHSPFLVESHIPSPLIPLAWVPV